MANLDTRPGPRQYLCSLRQHVREPISNALERAQREHREVACERDAFEAFADRVADISTASPDGQQFSSVTVLPNQVADDTTILRRAYRETVMAVPHYETVYDEPLMENVCTEFGPEVASLFELTTDTSLLAAQQRTVVSAATQAAAKRDEFCDTLEEEVASLRSLRDDLITVLDKLDSTIVPEWYDQQFSDELLEIIRTRQSQLAERSLAQLDGHNLCESLYHDEPQTYPVLTAVARLRECITIRG